MADRYAYSKVIKTKETGKQYLESTIYPRIKPTDNDLYIISEESDRLDLLSYKYYNDISLWWVIAIANNLNQASLHIEPGTQMRIPSNLSAILNEFEKINK